MKRHGLSSSLAVIGALAVVFLVAACGVRQQEQAGASLTSRVRSTITIRTGVTFGAPPVSSVPRMTAQQVYTKYMRHLGADTGKWKIPADVAVKLGLFTMPVGPGAKGKELYIAHNVLAYGFSWHSCYISSLRNAKRPSLKTCREWNFLNANTGAQIVETFQN